MNQSDPKLSIIVPVYNAESFIESCIECIESQTFSDYEVLFIDDGSTDRSFSLLQEQAEKDERIKVFSKSNKGVSNTRNFGLDIAKGEYIYFLDCDDSMEKDMMSSMIGLCEQYDADIAFCGYDKDFLENGQKVKTKAYSCDFMVANSAEEFGPILPVLLKNFLTGLVGSKLFRKSFIADLRFREDMHSAEDIVFNFTLFDKINKAVVTDQRYFHYVQRSTNTVGLSKKFNKDRYQYTELMFEKVIESFRKLGVFETSRQVAYDFFVTHMVLYFDIVLDKHNNLSFGERLFEIKKVLKSPLTKKILEDYQPTDKKRMLITKIFKTKNAFMNYLFFKVR
ncbi:MAG: hypothetical protein K0R90_1046 [Oscillospiraceae bacterium]|jgi:glycosyltransferase involved in cell wall biosynthesis|nr:hypothetical protein [Oscillospiraceae bacterium]